LITPAPDVVVAGKYLIESQLSEGGMGSLWVARHLDLDVKVAIKFLHPELVSDEVLRKRFAQEAKAAARINNRHVVDVKDHGIDDDLPYITMELLSGEDLRARLTRRGRLHPGEALHYLTQIVRALDDAHKLGIVHRDLKPENIFIARYGDDEIVKILDFGIAKWSLDIRTASGAIIGTLSYMSPEQVRGLKDLDARSDLWSLAVVLFEMITGNRIFTASTDIGASIKSIVTDPIPSVTSLAPELPAALDQFFFRALSRDRSKRYQNAPDLLDAFAEIVKSQPALPPPTHPQGQAAPPGARAEPPGAQSNGEFNPLVPTLPWPAFERKAGEPPHTDAYGATMPLHLVKRSPAAPAPAEPPREAGGGAKPMGPSIVQSPPAIPRDAAAPEALPAPPTPGHPAPGHLVKRPSTLWLLGLLTAIALLLAVLLARIL